MSPYKWPESPQSCSNDIDQETLQFIPSFFTYFEISGTQIDVDMPNKMKLFLNATN